MNLYYQVSLFAAMTGLVLITVAVASQQLGIWRTEDDDPDEHLLRNSAIVGLGMLLVIWAAIVAPVVGAN